jgi:hypothetical protein
MKSLVLFFIFLISSSVLSDNVFSEKEVRISFRYPEDWSERKPQLHTTLVLLYADDGSGATCNVTTKKFKKLHNLPEAQLEKLRVVNHSKQYFYEQSKDAFINLVINHFWRGVIGQKNAGIVEMEFDIFVNDQKSKIISFMGSTFANGRRITLLCNAQKNNIDSAKIAFDYIRSTMLFFY